MKLGFRVYGIHWTVQAQMKFAAEMQKLQDPSALLFSVMLIELMHAQMLKLYLGARNTDMMYQCIFETQEPGQGVHVQSLSVFFFFFYNVTCWGLEKGQHVLALPSC